MSRAPALVAMLLLGLPVQAETAAERLRKIRSLTLPPEQCYRVRDLFLEREDFKLHFSDGYLLFAEPIEGKAMAALFLAATDTGEGEIILMPPTASERQSLARFVAEPVLSENMRTAMMFFTDDTADALRRAMAENPFNRPEPEIGTKLAADWQPVARNLVVGYETRMLVDSFSQPGPGFFAAAISGARLGRFDVLVEPRRSEQISAGQVAWRDGQRYYDVWTSFPARSARGKGRAAQAPQLGSLDNYRIEATLAPELDMRVTARATFTAGAVRERVIPLELSSQLKVTQVLWDGRPIEYLQDEPLDSSAARRSGNNLLLVALEESPAPASQHEIEFQYEGNVIADAGHGVYFVGARGHWYPHRGLHYAGFDLLFHYPKRLQLVAPGQLIENSVDGEIRTSRWRPDAPIRVAGFNLGNFERASVRVGDYTLELCVNRNLEPALQPPPAPIPPPIVSPGRRPGIRASEVLNAPVQETPNPARRIDAMVRDSAETLQFFIERFGPPPLRHLTISPIPGRFGQGFPGLIYLSTLSYYQPQDRPLEKLSAADRLFYAEQLRAHEIAHQWWGNLITAGDYHDEWLMESLADYSALLFLERHKGAKALETVLAAYRNNLLTKVDPGDTVESTGAIVLGERLRTSKSPRGHQIITYEKGAWVLHMLRRLMGDTKFLSMLAELRRRFEYRELSTEQFRELAARFLPPARQDPNLENFFAQWIYGTGIPKFEMQYKVSGKAPRVKVTGVVKQSGVPDDFSVTLPIEIQVPGRPERVEARVQTANGETTFSVALNQRPARVLLDPKDSVLSVKQ